MALPALELTTPTGLLLPNPTRKIVTSVSTIHGSVRDLVAVLYVLIL